MVIFMLEWLLMPKIGLKSTIAEKVNTPKVYAHGRYSELNIFQIGKKQE